MAQLVALIIVGIFTIVVTTVLIKVVGALKFRIKEEPETTGLDLSAHGERAYDITS